MFCPQCGAPNEEEAVFCGNCGAVLNPDELSASEPEGETAEMAAAEHPEEEEPEQEMHAEQVPVAPPPPPVPAPPPLPHVPGVQTSGMAIASLVMGIVGWTFLPFIGSILAIVFGYAARNEIRRRPDELTGEGLAVAGLVLGWLMIGVTVLVLCLGAIGFCFFAGITGTSSY